MATKGYKGLLQDRVPQTVDFALKWCEAKTKWVDHVYNSFISIYVDKEQRNHAARVVLGMKDGKPIQFEFHSTIDWDNLSQEDKAYWIWVEGWVKWFEHMYLFIENAYELVEEYETDEEFLADLNDHHLKNMDADQQQLLGKYLLKCLKQNK